MMQKPKFPFFSSGPTKKYPGFSTEKLSSALLGRSHRSNIAIERINLLTQKIRQTLQIPDDFSIALIPGSATGAIETALWSFLGPRPTSIMAYDVFSKLWVMDLVGQLRLDKIKIYEAHFGELPVIENWNHENDYVLTWAATTTGVAIKDSSWIKQTSGVIIADLTAAVWTMDIAWEKIDVGAFSMQKGLGAEAGTGILVYNSRARQRLLEHYPKRSIPKLMSLFVADGTPNEKLAQGFILNTMSLLTIEDGIHALNWVESIGGLSALKELIVNNNKALLGAINSEYFSVLATDDVRAPAVLCLIPKHDQLKNWANIINMCAFLNDLAVAHDIKGHSLAVPCIRVWIGATIEADDLEALGHWLNYAYEKELKNESHASVDVSIPAGLS